MGDDRREHIQKEILERGEKYRHNRKRKVHEKRLLSQDSYLQKLVEKRLIRLISKKATT